MRTRTKKVFILNSMNGKAVGTRSKNKFRTKETKEALSKHYIERTRKRNMHKAKPKTYQNQTRKDGRKEHNKALSRISNAKMATIKKILNSANQSRKDGRKAHNKALRSYYVNLNENNSK